MLPDFPQLTQKGYVAVVLIIFALLMGLLAFPFKFPTPQSVGLQYIGTVPITTNGCQRPAGTAYAFQAKGYNLNKLGEESGDFKTTLNSDTVTYREVLRDVPILTSYLNNEINLNGFDGKGIRTNFNSENLIQIGGRNYYLLYPSGHGEVSPTNYAGSKYKFTIAENGLIFLAHTGSDLKPITIPGEVFDYKQKGDFLLTDVYQAESFTDTHPIPDLLVAECQGLNRGTKKEVRALADTPGIDVTPATVSGIIIPSQKVSEDRKQLQMQWFILDASQSATIAGAWATHCKPAIYLYPPKKQLVNVKVFPSGFLTYVDPPYDQSSGWTVEANPDGKLEVQNSKFKVQSYDYLYFESKIRDEVIRKPTKGWVVKFGELENLYKNILPKLSLNEKQTRDFIDYWKKSLPEVPYYFVGIIDQANVDQIERLEITPKPDSINRVRVYFERLDQPKQVETPELKTINHEPITNNFSVVEWGGMVKNDPNHPFTCSQ